MSSVILALRAHLDLGALVTRMVLPPAHEPILVLNGSTKQNMIVGGKILIRVSWQPVQFEWAAFMHLIDLNGASKIYSDGHLFTVQQCIFFFYNEKDSRGKCS
ncbi:TPA: hypothetical protein GDO54_018449 [Pyxicephalus adspersus]|uniref:Uncharacterized protein n=1 Tax=Pyxicephalus adspersus TaxID=30357 RepID=A0AAV2ZM71_PYXAD|nr:TPA: hypothetical protein GDO54_018449 [Pyxicephalus adspersus]